MGVFSCFQSPRALDRSQSWRSTSCFGTSEEGEEDEPDSPIVREHGCWPQSCQNVCNSTKENRVLTPRLPLSTSSSPPRERAGEHQTKFVSETTSSSVSKAKSLSRSPSVSIPPPPLSAKARNHHLSSEPAGPSTRSHVVEKRCVTTSSESSRVSQTDEVVTYDRPSIVELSSDRAPPTTAPRFIEPPVSPRYLQSKSELLNNRVSAAAAAPRFFESQSELSTERPHHTAAPRFVQSITTEPKASATVPHHIQSVSELRVKSGSPEAPRLIHQETRVSKEVIRDSTFRQDSENTTVEEEISSVEVESSASSAHSLHPGHLPTTSLNNWSQSGHKRIEGPSYDFECKGTKDTPSSSKPSTDSNEGSVLHLESTRPDHCDKNEQMDIRVQVRDGHHRISYDTEHVHDWEEYTNSSDRRHDLAEELHQEVEHDLAAQRRVKSRVRSASSRSVSPRPVSPRTPRSVTESCADSYCNRAESPLNQKSYESKFPHGYPEVHPISPPGWTYAPKRKNEKGELWDKDWPKNKRYLYYDPDLQPCGCHKNRKHAGSRTPSPPVSTRSRGMAYADKVVKINRERSLSPYSKSHSKLIPNREQKTNCRHRHVHLNWSCSNSTRDSSPRDSSTSRVYSPKRNKDDFSSGIGMSPPDYEPHVSRRSTKSQTQKKKTKAKLARSASPDYDSCYVSTEISPSNPSYSRDPSPPRTRELEPQSVSYLGNGNGYCAPLSQARTRPWPKSREQKSETNVRYYEDAPLASSKTQTSSRGVRTRRSAPPRQRPDSGQSIYIQVSSSSECSTPCSISVRTNLTFDDDERKPYSEDQLEDLQTINREIHIGPNGHCHTPGSWSCTPRESTPNTPRKLATPRADTQRATSRSSTPKKAAAGRESDYTVTITCPQDKKPTTNQDDLTQEKILTNPTRACQCPCHFPCSQPCPGQQCCCQTGPNVIGGNCNWHQVVHHHRTVSYCCCHY